MTYNDYIKSPTWKAIRRERLDLDGGLCVVCRKPATSVHHIRYPKTFGQEDILNDMISVCDVHHRDFDTIERFHRYSLRIHKVDTIAPIIQERKEKDHGLQQLEGACKGK